MQLCRVDGSAVSTIHHPTLRGWRQLICQPLNADGQASGDPILAMDDLGAGLHQQVLVTADGKAIGERVGTRHTPLRYMVVAIADPQEPTHA